MMVGQRRRRSAALVVVLALAAALPGSVIYGADAGAPEIVSAPAATSAAAAAAAARSSDATSHNNNNVNNNIIDDSDNSTMTCTQVAGDPSRWECGGGELFTREKTSLTARVFALARDVTEDILGFLGGVLSDVWHGLDATAGRFFHWLGAWLDRWVWEPLKHEAEAWIAWFSGTLLAPHSKGEEWAFRMTFVAVLGWLALMTAPRWVGTPKVVAAIALFLAVLYAPVLFLGYYQEGVPDFLHFDGWVKAMSGRMFVLAGTYHFFAYDLLIGSLVTHDFYTKFEATMVSRAVVTVVMVFGYIMGPLGYLMYQLATVSVLKKYALIPDRPRRFKDKEAEVTAELCDPVPSGHPLIDSLPLPLRHIAYVVEAVLGAALFLFCASIYVVFTALSFVVWVMTCRPVRRVSAQHFWPLNFAVIPVARLRLWWTFTAKNNWFFRIVFFWVPYGLDFAYFADFLPCKFDPEAYIDTLVGEFGPVFPFGDGIGFATHKDVKKQLQSKKLYKGYESLGWRVSSSQKNFCKYTTTFYPQGADTKWIVEEGREVVAAWLGSTYSLADDVTRARLNTLLPFRPPNGDMLKESRLESTFGEALFHLLTGGELTVPERHEYEGAVNNFAPFLPDWISFMQVGGYLERKGVNGYTALRDALARYPNAPALKKALQTAEKTDFHSTGEVVRLLATVLAIAGAAAPAKLLTAVVKRLYSDPEKGYPMLKLYGTTMKEKVTFIKECARLDRGVPIVNTFAHKEQKVMIGDFSYNVPVGTPLHCSIVNANRDPTVFENPEDFNPARSDLLQLMTWNGVEQEIVAAESGRPAPPHPTEDAHPAPARSAQELNKLTVKDLKDELNVLGLPVDGRKSDLVKRLASAEAEGTGSGASNDSASHRAPRGASSDAVVGPPRSCQGHDIAIQLLVFLVDRYKPEPTPKLDPEEYASCNKKIALYTRFLLWAGKKYCWNWNTQPPRAADALYPADAVQKELKLVTTEFGVQLPTYDEDNPISAIVPMVKWALQTPLAPILDRHSEWASPDQAIMWRNQMFGALFPPMNLDLPQLLKPEGIETLCFATTGMQHTRKVARSRENLPQCPANAVYVNENLVLSTYEVRGGFQNYGAAAYFNKDRKLCAIYTCYNESLVTRPGTTADKRHKKDWKHAQWVFKVSNEALVTLKDHLIQIHMVESNALVLASRTWLSPHHPLRAMLKIFTYSTAEINFNAYDTLICRKGLVERIWAFTSDALQDLLKDLRKDYKFKPLPFHIDESMRSLPCEQFPPNKDLPEFWGIVREFVANFFDIVYHGSEEEMDRDWDLCKFLDALSDQLKHDCRSKESCIDAITHLICVVTSWHEHVGQISDYFMNPRYCGTKLRAGMEIDDMDTYALKCALISLTGLRMPRLLDNWNHLLSRGEFGFRVTAAFDSFHDELVEMYKRVKKRNETRGILQVRSWDPMAMESSVSV